MSEDEKPREPEEEQESPPTILGVPEKQPLDLGIHKVVICTGDTHVDEKLKPTDAPAASITIVQDEFCQWEKDKNLKFREVRRKIITASLICILFIAMEFVGGYVSNSLVIAADAGQLLTVFSTLMVSMFALRLKDRRNGQPPRGWCSGEVLTALISVLCTWVLTSIVLYLAFCRLLVGDFIIDVDMMLATSAFGVVANLVMGMVLHNNCQLQYPSSKCDEGEDPGVINLNVRAAFLHIVCDFLFSLAVFITALFIDCCPDYHIIDPICTFVFSLVILVITLAILKDILRLLVEETPKGIVMSEVVKTLLSIEGVQQVCDVRLWALTLGEKTALSAHITIRPGVDYNEVLRIASRRTYVKYNFAEMTLHVEALREDPDQLRIQLEK